MENPKLLPELRFTPAVFAVKDEYQIIVLARAEIVFWVTVNGKEYYDWSSGVLRSAGSPHRVSVPMSELDAAREYTVHYRRMVDRLIAFSTTEEVQSATYPFKPVDPNGDIRLCQVADVLAVKTFDNLSNPMNAGDFFGENLDLLVLNGNIQNNSEQTFKFDFIYRFCDRLAHGNIPIVFSRGERDMRGAAAELMEYYTPTDRGVSYYSFRLGSLWGLVLDAAEDKDDSCPEYGFTNCCHEFRLQETRWLQSVIDNARNEYAAPGVKYRLVISTARFSTHRTRRMTLNSRFIQSGARC